MTPTLRHWYRDPDALQRLLADLAAAGIPAGAMLEADTAAGLATINGGTGVTFRSSGSLGEPRAIHHGWDRLDEEIAFQAGLHAAGGFAVRRVVSLVPAQHIYGFLVTVLLPQALGVRGGMPGGVQGGVPVADLRGQRPAAVIEQLRPGDLVAGFPDAWHALAAARRRLPPQVRGITSTAPCPPATATALAEAGLDRLVELYGASETAGIGWRDRAGDPFTLFPWWELSDDAATLRHRTSGACFILPDRVAAADAGTVARITVLGRRDGAIQIGGINVFPDRVAALLRGHPHVSDAVVRPYRVGRGLRLKAFVVPRDSGGDAAALRTEIEAWLRASLSPAERPRHLTLGAAVPRGALGKAADWIVADGDAAREPG